MKSINSVIAWTIAVLLLGGASVYLIYGTISPCGVLKAKIQNQTRRDGAIIGTLLLMAPDEIAEALLEGIYGKLTPGNCILALLSPKTDGNSDLQTVSVDPTSKLRSSMSKKERERLLDQGAESLARQAFDLCRTVAGRPLGGPYTLDDPCIGNAVKAWNATGALPPYAHPCFEKGAQLDFLGRCL